MYEFRDAKHGKFVTPTSNNELRHNLERWKNN